MSDAASEFQTNLVRVADAKYFETRHQLRALRGGRLVDDAPLTRYPLGQLGRQANIVVQLVEGRGQDPDELRLALRQFRKALEMSGTWRLMRDRTGRLYEAASPSVRRRQKQLAARRAARKRVMRAERRETWREGD